MSGLIKWDEIERQICIEKDLSVLKTYHAALGSKEFRKQIDGSIKAINKCEKYKIKIEIAFGEHYKKLESEERKRTDLSVSGDLTQKQQAQEEIGKSRETINKYARMATVEKTDEFLEEYEAKCNDRGVEMSSAGFLKFAREKQHEDLPKVELPEGKYNVIYADPPWPVGSIVMDKWESPINEKYPTMTMDEIRNLPIRDLSAENCALFLWTTHSYLPDAFRLIEYWGFKYHCVITWNKHSGWTQFGFHKMTEFLIYAYKGKMNINQYGKAIPTLIEENKTHHSKKPDSIRDLIKSKTPEGRIELFARDKYEGWEAWGNQL